MILIVRSEEAYVPPKKPYSFLAMLDDILEFAALSLVDNGRLSFWMPTANDLDQEIEIPHHPSLRVISVCTQTFNKCQCFAKLSRL
jgi:tRNA (guanine10-N2)-methyltransferase